MHYEITRERQIYLQARGYIVLSACPGSGKTTSIVRKLKDVADYCTTTYGKHTGFACLSFTNNACDEIKSKYHVMHGEWLNYPNLVSTIDSFIMQTVVMPFWYLYQDCIHRPVVVNDESLLKQIFQTRYVDKNGHEKVGFVYDLRNYYDLAYGSIPPEKVNLKLYRKYKVAADADGHKKYEYCKAVMKYRIRK